MKLFQFLKPKKKKVFFSDNIKVVKSPSRKKTITLRVKKVLQKYYVHYTREKRFLGRLLIQKMSGY